MQRHFLSPSALLPDSLLATAATTPPASRAQELGNIVQVLVLK